MGHAFISYSHKDGAYVDRLTAYLAGAGIEVWTDRGIEHGAEWSGRSTGNSGSVPPSSR